MGRSSTAKSKIPCDDILESLYKLRIRKSAQLKTVLELYEMEIHLKISMLSPTEEQLKRMVSPWAQPAAEKRRRTRSLWASAHARVSWCLAWKLVGGGLERQIFLRLRSRARARREGFLMRKRVEHAWRLRWRSLLSCTAARAVAVSLLELPGAHGADGVCPPTHEVERDFRFAGLAP